MIMQNPLVSALPALLTSFGVPTAVTANQIQWRRHSLRYEITKSRVGPNVTRSTNGIYYVIGNSNSSDA